MTSSAPVSDLTGWNRTPFSADGVTHDCYEKGQGEYPVLYYAHEVPHHWKWLLDINPLGGLLTAWSDVLNKGFAPPPWSLLLATGWAFGILIAGALFFTSREREFAVLL